jgi:uroporphyrin-III C-methyltransferase/precorrin-2 dehydrogenase/sirohydrochlorin ferrochelatase/uroporphyrin-III C-methyltransferase
MDEGQPEPWVYLVGAGPGDPDLLTRKAERLLRRADAVVYDRLVGEGVLDLVPRGATRLYVGKASGQHHLKQAEINQLLVRLARPGRIVVRLKGGDPFIFGRGCEEVEHLSAHGVPYEVVPGVTAASGCAAALGIPLTHRGLAHSVRFITGHCRNDQELALDWAGLADPATTLVVYMGLANADQISARLIEAGLPAATPAAVIERGTTPGERALRTTLGELPATLVASAVRAPVLLVIGRVVAIAPGLEMADRETWLGEQASRA